MSTKISILYKKIPLSIFFVKQIMITDAKL